MKVCVVYYDGSSTGEYEQLLKNWLKCYETSPSSLPLCLLTDGKTAVPSFWTHEVVSLDDSQLPADVDSRHKAGWMKSMAYDLVGRSIVIDVDALVFGNLDELANMNCTIGMAADVTRQLYADWPEVGEELNTGMMICDSFIISRLFQKLYEEKQEFRQLPKFDQLIFSAICREIGVIFDEAYNCSYWHGESKENACVIHFHDDGQKQIEEYLAKRFPKISSATAAPGGVVTVRYTGRLPDGTIFDQTSHKEPFQFCIGSGHVIPGFEEALMGMRAGESTTTTVPYDKAYGKYRENMLAEVDREKFPADLEIKLGEYLDIPRSDGDPLLVRVSRIDGPHILLDGNHPLAGRNLTFDIELLDVV